MIINELFQNEPITINSYLSKCGVKDVEEYFSGVYIEPLVHYDNIEQMALELLSFTKKEKYERRLF